MKLTTKGRANRTAAYMAGCMALSAATTANAADLSGVTNSVTSSVNDIVNVITPIAWAVVGNSRYRHYGLCADVGRRQGKGKGQVTHNSSRYRLESCGRCKHHRKLVDKLADL